MKRRIAFWGIAAVLICGYFITGWFIARDGTTDTQQIGSLIERGKIAIERHDLGDIVACVSGDYRDNNGLTYMTLRVQAAQWLRTGRDIKIAGRILSVQVAGVEGRTAYHATVRVDGESVFNGDLSLYLKKEPAWRYLVFRVREWKVVAVEGYPSVLE